MHGDRNPTLGFRGILAEANRLDPWLSASFVALTLASTLRYLNGHGLSDRGPTILTVALALALVFGAPTFLSLRTTRMAIVWCSSLLLCWFVLVVLAPSFSWVAVPLSFVALRVFPFRTATAVVAVMTLTVIATWTEMQGRLDPTIIVGPICIAGLAVGASRILERDANRRRQLLDDLEEAQGLLAQTQHDAGVLAERARLSREIHDSVAQRLSSINLLCQAADQRWTAQPSAAREYINQAALTSRDGLDEVRRVVRDLAPEALINDQTGSVLPTALKDACEQATHDSGVRLDVRVDGQPSPVPPEVATAILRTARGALANVVEHAHATTATVSLTYQQDSISLDVRDNGVGFETSLRDGDASRGTGIAGIRNRAENFGGTAVVETSPTDGTTIVVNLPLVKGR